MKDKRFFQLIITATILTTTIATKDSLLSLLPALPIPDARPTPEYVPKPAAPACQSLNVNHTGFNASQAPGDVLLCQQSPKPTSPTNIVGTTTSRVIKTTTTNTTTTEVRTVTTTTTTTIEATTTSTNTTVPMDVKPCVVFEGSNGTQYNWWQVLLESGGKPGTFRDTGNPEIKDSPPINPCVRPLESQHPEIYAYKHEGTDGETYTRKEIGYRRFYGTPNNEFLDVRGDIIWKPPIQANDKRMYLVHYILDDTGFWVNASTYCIAEYCKIRAPLGRNANMF